MKDPRSAWEKLQDYELVMDAMRAGVRDALRRHKLLGESIVIFDDDGNPEVVPPEKIQVDD